MEDQTIWTQIRLKKIKISRQQTNQKIRQILNALGYDQVELSVVITGDTEIQSLNNSYRGINKPTNVLSFPMAEGSFSDINPGLLGDIVISAETAVKEAEEAGITLEERLSQLLVHGILHLVGFDHETFEADAGKMAAKSSELLRIIEKNRNLDIF